MDLVPSTPWPGTTTLAPSPELGLATPVPWKMVMEKMLPTLGSYPEPEASSSWTMPQLGLEALPE